MFKCQSNLFTHSFNVFLNYNTRSKITYERLFQIETGGFFGLRQIFLRTNGII